MCQRYRSAAFSKPAQPRSSHQAREYELVSFGPLSLRIDCDKSHFRSTPSNMRHPPTGGVGYTSNAGHSPVKPSTMLSIRIARPPAIAS